MQQVNQPNLVQKIQQRISEEFLRAITETQFPVGRLSEQWKKCAHDALEYGSPATMGIKPIDFQRLAFQSPWKKDYSLSYLDFATLSNNMENRSAKDLGLAIGEYVNLVTEAHEHVEFYRESTTLIGKAIEQKVKEEEAANGTKVNADKPAGLQPIMGEA